MKILLNGAAGRMGKIVSQVAEADESCEIAAKVDKMSEGLELKKLEDCKTDCDVIIDFSFHGLTGELCAYSIQHNLPLVICTTGHSLDELKIIREASAKIPLFFSGNMSVGIAALYEFSKKAAQLFPDADIEIVEAHHNRKLDAPSGTATMLADGIKEVRKDAELVYGRHGNAKRQANEIGIHSLRMGNEPGMHEVLISTDYQTLSLRHNAHDRAVFAEGALAAAKWLQAKGPGLYNMQDMLGSE